MIDWVIIGTWIAFAGVMTPILITILSTARQNGRLDHRVETLEASMIKNEVEHTEIKNLAYKTDRMVSKLEDLPESVHSLSEKMDQVLILLGKERQEYNHVQTRV